MNSFKIEIRRHNPRDPEAPRFAAYKGTSYLQCYETLQEAMAGCVSVALIGGGNAFHLSVGDEPRRD